MESSSNTLPWKVHSDSVVGANAAFLWLAIPKNASRSLLRVFETRGQRLGDLADGAPMKEWLRQASLPAWSFAAVRHPEARLVSAWMNKVVIPPNTPNQATLWANNPGLVAGMSLDSFLDWLTDAIKAKGVDAHWRPQHHFICDKAGVRRVDFLARCEQLARDLGVIGDRIGSIADLPRLNPTTGEEQRLELTTIQKRRIQAICARDYEILGYD
jgi:hypothetical protein